MERQSTSKNHISLMEKTFSSSLDQEANQSKMLNFRWHKTVNR
jgi:hypothetical protein